MPIPDLISRKLAPGEPIEEFVADLKRLTSSLDCSLKSRRWKSEPSSRGCRQSSPSRSRASRGSKGMDLIELVDMARPLVAAPSASAVAQAGYFEEEDDYDDYNYDDYHYEDDYYEEEWVDNVGAAAYAEDGAGGWATGLLVLWGPSQAAKLPEADARVRREADAVEAAVVAVVASEEDLEGVGQDAAAEADQEGDLDEAFAELPNCRRETGASRRGRPAPAQL